MKDSDSNEVFDLAVQLINHSSCNVFLTGKAGTGKTTFLKYIRENCPKQLAVVAPTGVAAINANGVTIHSFFQLPLVPFIPESAEALSNLADVANSHSLIRRLKLNMEKKKLLQELELLIIDEISMVRCDLLDAVDTVLRYIRHRHRERFGGVQVLFIGDMYQLAPVVKDEEWKFLSEYYCGPYFFDSKVLMEEPPVFIEFTKVYRQTDERFINLLNQVRNNQLDHEGEAILESRYLPHFQQKEHRGYIVLTTHNQKVRSINTAELRKLSGNQFVYKAEIRGEFSVTAYPADEALELKLGAQVMFIRNDPDKSKRYFNGKIGVVTALDQEKICVQCTGEDSTIEVKKETWENIRYSLNRSTRQLDEQVLGSFTQYPLRLAWAITIHKSQGLTFEKAIIDAGDAFTAGQVYVALSRCASLEGMVLHSKLNPHSLLIDERIVEFSKRFHPADKLQAGLDKARYNYEQKILFSIFSFERTHAEVKELHEYLSKNASAFNAEALPWAEELMRLVSNIHQTSKRFCDQLVSLFSQTQRLAENSFLLQRIEAAVVYFDNELNGINQFLRQSPVSTGSRHDSKMFNDSMKEVFIQLSLKKHLLEGMKGKFDVEVFHSRKKSFVAPPVPINSYAGGSDRKTERPHPALHFELKKLRDLICLKRDLPVYLVAGRKTLEEMELYLPQTIDELGKINGFGKMKLEKYGKEFLDIIVEYCQKHGLNSRISEKMNDEKGNSFGAAKSGTKAESFRLYKTGKTIKDIAAERHLAVSTIEAHLAHYVRSGEIRIEELVSPQKVILVEPLLKEFNGDRVGLVKEKLGENVSYGEIRFVMAWQEFQRELSSHVDH